MTCVRGALFTHRVSILLNSQVGRPLFTLIICSHCINSCSFFIRRGQGYTSAYGDALHHPARISIRMHTHAMKVQYLKRLCFPCCDQLVISLLFDGVKCLIEILLVQLVDTCSFSAGCLLENVVLVTEVELAGFVLVLSLNGIAISNELDFVLALLTARFQLVMGRGEKGVA